MKKLAQFYEKQEGKIRCLLCPHRCLIGQGEKGKCKVRYVERDGSGKLKFYTLNYGEVTSIALDPIQKKPLAYFCPDTDILSIGSFGCNLGCKFCQNYAIAHGQPESQYYSPKDIVDVLKKFPQSIGVAFTYNEPTVWYEYVYDTAIAIKKALPNKKIVLVTNGYINGEPLKKLLPYVDAMNIDLKGDLAFYQEICEGTLGPVKRTIQMAYSEGCHIEITNLLVGDHNTSDEQLKEIGEFIQSIDPTIPVHLTRYYPNYQMEEPPTSFETLQRGYNILKSILQRVEVGNITYGEKLLLEQSNTKDNQ